MKEFRRILFATDLSESADSARNLAMMLARQHKAELHVLHVNIMSAMHMRHRGVSAAEAYVQVLVDACQRALDAIPDVPGVTMRRAVHSDESPASGILDYAEENGVDLIVIGTHGLSGVKRWLLGSVAAKVVRSAKCAVLVASHDDHGADAGAGQTNAQSFDRILAATDLSEHSQQGVQRAAQLAKEHDAKLSVVYVLVPPVANPYDQEVISQATDIDAGKQALARFIGKLALDVEPELLVRVGAAHAEVTAAAEEAESDLLVISAFGYSAFERLLFGSVADKIVRSARCPVLVSRAAAT